MRAGREPQTSAFWWGIRAGGLATALLLAQPACADPGFLSPAQFDPAVLLPTPSADGSPAEAAELAELHRIENIRTDEQLARAKADASNETVTMFADVLGPSFDIGKLPATGKLFERIAADEEAISKSFKAYFHRTRPYDADPSLKDCGHNLSKNGKTSYPSGHASVAYAMGAVLAKLIPARAQDILNRSASFAENRLICGVHYRSDIEAGHVLGMLIAAKLEQDDEFQSEFLAAQAELQASGIASY